MVIYAPGWTEAFVWAVVLGFLTAFLLAFAMGANDCANSYGPAIGSKVLKLRTAYILATVFEIAGALLLGYEVTDTVRQDLIHIKEYNVYSIQQPSGSYVLTSACLNSSSSATTCTMYSEASFLIGCLGGLIGCGAFLIMATVAKMPVSTTHSTIGATIGFSLVLKGHESVKWYTILNIVVSWIASPLLAGIFSTLFYAAIKLLAFNQPDPIARSFLILPYIFAFCVFINAFSVIYNGSKYLGFNKLPWWSVILISSLIALIVGVVIKYFALPRIRTRLAQEKLDQSSKSKMQQGQNTVNRQKRTISQRLVGLLTLSKSPTYSTGYGPDGSISITASSYPSSCPNSSLDQQLNRSHSYSEAVTSTESSVQASPGILLKLPAKTVEVLPAASYGELVTFLNESAQTDGTTNSVFTQRSRRQSYLDLLDAKDEQMKGNANSLTLRNLLKPSDEPVEASKVFSSLQVLSSVFISFSHGSNDTANAIGLLVAQWVAYKYGDAMYESDVSNWIIEGIIFYGAVAMIVGLWVLGHKVIETVGNNITAITPASGFCMQFGTAFTVLLCSKIGIPVSTTHCLIGAIVAVGYFRTRQGVSWKILSNIAIAWLVTLPVSMGISAFMTWIFSFAL